MKRAENGENKLPRFAWVVLGILCGQLAFAQTKAVNDLRDVSVFTAKLGAQFQAIDQEKKSWTPAQKKMSSELVFRGKKVLGKQVAPGLPERIVLGKAVEGQEADSLDTQILVDIHANVTDELLERIIALGGSVVSEHRRFNALRALVPLRQLEAVADEREVRSIREAIRPMVNKTNTSEGVLAHRAGTGRADFGVTGAGVKVGVISDSVRYLSTVQSSGDLPSTVTVLPGQSGVSSGDLGEGTAMLEIVYDVAPGSSLYFATGFGTLAQFAQNILDLRAAGCNVIVDDVSNASEPVFQDGIVAQAVSEVVADGCLYFSSAGNSGNKDDGTSGVWEGDFVATSSSFQGGTVHSFGGYDYNQLTAQPSRYISLQWSDPWGASANDYDLYLVDGSANIIKSSANVQNGDDDPFEIIDTSDADYKDYRVIVVRYGSSASRYLHLDAYRAGLHISTQGQTYGHSAAAAAVTVAAVTTPARVFTTSDTVATYTSDGPRRIFFESDGSAITPGNFLSTGGRLLNKPDLTAAAGVSCATPAIVDGHQIFCPFNGTSASAPHAAGIAALMLQKNGTLTPSQLKTIMSASVWDIEASGWDRDSGYGILNAYTALANTPANTKTLSSITVAGASSVTSGNTATYICTATYSDSSTATVTPTWSLSSTTYATITSGGLLSAKSVSSSQSVTVQASYTENSVTKVASKTVTVNPSAVLLNVDVPPAGGSANSSSLTNNGSVWTFDSTGYPAWVTGLWVQTETGNFLYLGLGEENRLGWLGSGYVYVSATANTTGASRSWTLPITTASGTSYQILFLQAISLSTPSAPTGLSASDGTSTANVAISWTASSGATGYQVYRHTDSSSASASLMGDVSTTSYTDGGATPGTLYYYWAKATNSAGTSAFGSPDTGYRALSAPTGVSASDTATSAVTVTWNTVMGASYYRVYRAVSSSGTKSTLGSWRTALSYVDNTGTAGTNYFYWVVAAVDSAGTRASAYSDYDTGIMPISGLTLEAALDATNLVWTTGGSANWFAQTVTTYDGVDAAQSGALGDNQTNWLQTTVSGPGTLSFWQKVSSASGDWLSLTIDGTAAGSTSGDASWVQVTKAITGTGTHVLRWTYSKNASTSSGSDCAWVDRVTWTSGLDPCDIVFHTPTGWSGGFLLSNTPDGRTNMTGFAVGETIYYAFAVSEKNNGIIPGLSLSNSIYKVVSGITNASTLCIFLGGIDNNSWRGFYGSYCNWSELQGLTAGVYKVVCVLNDGRAINETEYSNNTCSLTFFVGSATPIAPLNVAASDGTYADKVRVSWLPSDGATHYQVSRSTSVGGSKIDLGSWQSSTSYDDTSVLSGTNYYYWVRAATSSSGDHASGYSSGDTGFAASPEIDVQGNGQTIPDGDVTPIANDHTDFGSVVAAGGTLSRTFTIRNTGTAALNLTGAPRVSVSGAYASEFTVTSQPATPVAAGGSTAFTVQFAPAGMGLRMATLSITNNDADENTFDFAIQGTGYNVSIQTDTASVAVPEGGMATIRVKLSAQPSANVTVAVVRSSGDTDVSVTGGASMTFTTANWNTYQTVTLAAVQDTDTTAGSATFTCSAANLTSVDVTATEVDNDTTLTVAAGTGGTVSPSGATVVTVGAATSVTATPGANYVFANWSFTSGSGSFANAGAASTTVSVTAPATIQANFTAQQQVATPVISPTNGTQFTTASKRVTITNSTVGAEIRYTTNGVDPTVSSALYTGAFNIYATTTVKARGYKSGMLASEIAVAVITKPATLTLADALDVSAWAVTTGGDSSWTPQAAVTHDSVDAVRTGSIGASQTTWLETSISGAGTLTFWWRASCEDSPDDDWDFMTFAVGGVEKARVDGDSEWQHVSVTLPAGSHTLRWTYSKDDADEVVNEDCGWVDQVTWSPVGGSTTTTEVPVPYTWLDQFGLVVGGDYEGAALADIDGDGLLTWQEYLTGTVPTNRDSVFRASIMLSNGVPFVTWTPDLGTGRVYTVEGKASLTNAAWLSPTNAATRFFRVKVAPKN